VWQLRHAVSLGHRGWERAGARARWQHRRTLPGLRWNGHDPRRALQRCGWSHRGRECTGGEKGLSDLIHLLEQWQLEPPSPEVASEALRTEAPQLAALLQRFVPRSSAALAAWIAVLLAILQLIQGCQERGIEIQQTEIDRVTIEAIEREANERR
jgi:hypothetical protein